METKIFKRLIIFAKHLATLKNHPRMGDYNYAILCSMIDGKQYQFGTCYHAWIFDDLPLLFDKEWYYNDKLKQPFLIGLDEEEESLSGVFDFFKLTEHEFCHLFDLEGLQNTYYYGGRFLNPKSEGPEISKNIFEFIQHKMMFNPFKSNLN